MAIYLPNVCGFREVTRRNPILLSNLDFLMEDFISRISTDHRKKSCSNNDKSKLSQPEQTVGETSKGSNANKEEPITSFDKLIKSAREAMNELEESQEPTAENNNKDELANSQEDSKCDDKNISEPKERIIPIVTGSSSDYEYKFNFDGCSSSSLNIGIADGILTATGKKEEEGITKTVSYEKILPVDMDTSSLKATFLENGTLQITAKKSEIISTPKVHKLDET